MTMGQVADAEHRFNHRATARQSTLNFRARLCAGYPMANELADKQASTRGRGSDQQRDEHEYHQVSRAPPRELQHADRLRQEVTASTPHVVANRAGPSPPYSMSAIRNAGLIDA
jgi:hypothetical protein